MTQGIRGSLYFIQEGADGCVKIGWTRNAVSRRLHNLQTGNRSRLHLIGVIANAPAAEEAGWHKRFRHVRERAEWFKPDPLLLAAVRKEAAHPEQRPTKSHGLSMANLGIGPPALLRLRAGYLQGDFTLRRIADATGIPITTLSNMLNPNWRRAFLEKLQRLEAAINQLTIEGRATTAA